MSRYSKRYADAFPDDHFQNAFSDWIHDIEILSVENGSIYGICYPDSRITRTYLAKHEAESDILNTMQHEPIHACLSDFQFEVDEDEEMLCIDIEQEHKIIQKMSWIANEKIFDKGYFSLYNGKEITPLISEKEYNNLMKKYNKESRKIDECKN
jgi:hypothetical protein